MDFPWQDFSDPDPDTELHGVVGYLHPTGYQTVPRVLWQTRKIESQLAESAGLVGYSLRADFFKKKFWAVAAWETADSLDTFVETDPHAKIRANLRRAMAESWFERFDLSGAEVPMSVDDALKRV